MGLLKSGKLSIWKIGSHSVGAGRTQVILIGCLWIAYVGTFFMLFGHFGLFLSILLIIPVNATGYAFGRNAGLIAGIFAFILNIFLSTGFQSYTLTQITRYWPGYVVILASGYFTGYLRDEILVRKQISVENASRERFIALMNIANKSITGANKLEDAYFRLIMHLTNLFVADYAYLIRWEGTAKQAQLIAATKPLVQTYFPIQLEPEEVSVAMEVLQAGRPKIIEDVQSSTYIVNPSPFKELALPTKSALIIPFIRKDYYFGVAILAFDTPRRFTPEEIIYVELAANQITLTLRTIFQQLEIEAKLKEAKALAKIERALSESERVGVNMVLQLIVQSAKELIPKAKNVILHLIDEEGQILVPRAVVGYRKRAKGSLNMRLGEGIAGTVMATGQVINISDVRTDPRFLNQTLPVKFRSLVVAPILSKEQCIGTISIQSDSPGAFDESEVTLLETLGTQVAIGIDNARLLETTRQNLKEIDILYRISRGLAGSLDPDQIMKYVVDLLQQSFGYHHVMIYMVDHENGDLAARQGCGEIALRLVEQGYRNPIDKGIIGHVVITGEAFLTNNVESVLFYLRHPDLVDVKSELAVPILIEDQVAGVIDIQQKTPHVFTEDQLNLLSAVAGQLAVALQKANLYNTLQTSLTLEKTMRTKLTQNERLAMAGQLLASVSHELNNPIQAIQNVLYLLEQDENLSLQGEQDLKIIVSEVERMATLLNRLRATYRPIQSDEIEEIQLNEIIEDIHSLTSTHMRHNQVSFQFHPDPGLPTIRGVSDQIRQVVLNLFINAIEAMQNGGHLTVYTQQIPESEQALLTISDTGHGINPEILPRIFEAFFTTKKTGTGLGLSITSEIIHQHGGEIQVENNAQGGATFQVWFSLEYGE